MPVMGADVVATSQPLAAQAGMEAFCRGGNAADAALAAAIALTIVEPTSNGIGSDAFALIWAEDKLHGLNASGRSPAGWTREHFSKYDAMPQLGWDSVTVPGCVSAWQAVSRRFGRLPFADLFPAAIRYAQEGFPVSPITARAWKRAEERFAAFPNFTEAFLPGGKAPLVGDLFALPEAARTLEQIAASDGDSFYRGALAERLVACAEQEGGLLRGEDLAGHRPFWCEPITQEFHGLELAEIPPNGQGLAALIALGILKHTPLADHKRDSAAAMHLQIEAMKLALADAHAYIADPQAMAAVSTRRLLDPEYLRRRSALIDPKEARPATHGVPTDHGTVYLSAADRDGMMVSFIQSNYWGFGSGVVVPGTGISLQNRGWGFTREPGHPNEVGPRKLPFHTIIPGFVLRGGRPLMSFGVMGGPIQAQGHVQMMVRLALYRQNPQAASDAPRWRVLNGNAVALEQGMDPEAINGLRDLGHEVTVLDPTEFGGAQLIYRLEHGHYCAGSDSRKDGQAVAR